jgi:hypothetical protein
MREPRPSEAVHDLADRTVAPDDYEQAFTPFPSSLRGVSGASRSDPLEIVAFQLSVKLFGLMAPPLDAGLQITRAFTFGLSITSPCVVHICHRFLMKNNQAG